MRRDHAVAEDADQKDLLRSKVVNQTHQSSRGWLRLQVRAVAVVEQLLLHPALLGFTSPQRI
jgi:hypothetical protein